MYNFTCCKILNSHTYGTRPKWISIKTLLVPEQLMALVSKPLQLSGQSSLPVAVFS